MTIGSRDLWTQFRSWWGGLRLWVKVVVGLAAIAGIGFAVAQVGSPPPQHAALTLSPATAVVEVGRTLAVSVVVGNPDGLNVLAVEAELAYDPALLEITNAECSATVTEACINTAGSAFTTPVEQSVSGGIIRIVRGAPAPGIASVSTTLATLRFRTLAAGNATVGITQANSHVVVVSGGQAVDILIHIENGSYGIGGMSCTAPPPAGYGGFICAAAAGGKTCSGGTNAGNVCTSDAQCPVPGKCKTGTGVRTCENNINLPCEDDFECTERAPCTPSSVSVQVCSNDPSKLCNTDTDCPIHTNLLCKLSTNECVRPPTGAPCDVDAECQEYGTCGTAQGTVVCLGTEYPDSDTTTVCCSAACTVIQPGQLYIRNVTLATVSANQSVGSESITWATFPIIPVATSCQTTYTPAGGPQAGSPPPTTGDPTDHSIALVDLPVNVTYNFTIVCSAAGYQNATHTGTFRLDASAADELRIEDLAVVDITYQSARVSYGTNNKDALGEVWLAAGACSSPGTFARMQQDTVATRAHQALLTGLTPNTTYCVEARATAGAQTAAPARHEFRTLEQKNILPDANVIMKVARDRVCKNWLFCQSSVRLRNQQGKDEDLCFDLGVCDTLDPNGACANPVSLEGKINRAELTYQSPLQAELVKDISGYAKVGLDWSYCSDASDRACKVNQDCCNNVDINGNCTNGASCVHPNERLEGLYPYVRMSEIGKVVQVRNGNFESGELSPWRAQGGASLTPPYRSSNDRGDYSYILRVTPGTGTYTGARVPLGVLYAVGDPFELTFRARADEGGKGHCSITVSRACDPETPASCPGGEECVIGKRIRAQLAQLGGSQTYYNFATMAGESYVDLNSGWATYQMRLGVPPLPANFGANTELQFVQYQLDGASTDSFYLDDVVMQPVLETTAATTLPRSCRLYPKPDAPSCDFLEPSTGKEYRGWKGYCIERQNPDPAKALDPANDCLIWWPVDVLSGASDLFAGEGVAGYKDRYPLYYCLESKGDWPYYDRQIGEAMDSGGGADMRLWTFDASTLDVHRDEIIEIRVNGVKIDHDGDSSGDCRLYVENAGTNQADASGVLYLNKENKAHWSDAFGKNKTCDGAERQGEFNSYSWLRCSDRGSENDCNTMSMRAEFNTQGFLQQVQVRYIDGRNEGRGQFSSVTITYRGERCNVIAQVVTPEGDATPYTSKLAPGGWANPLQYPYGHDFIPYGGLVLPDGVDAGNPELWPKPAYVEAPLTQNQQDAPQYQYRAGSPYGVGGNKACVGSGQSCNEDSQCDSYGTCGFDQSAQEYICDNNGALCPGGSSDCFVAGTCAAVSPTEGGRVCITGDPDRLGEPCTADDHCGFVQGGGNTVAGICAGLDKPATTLGGDPRPFSWREYYQALSGGAARGATTLSQLFARAYGVWAFDRATGRYKECVYETGSTAQNPPGCVQPWPVPASVPASTQPRVRQIVVEAPEVIKRAGGVTLKFTAALNADHYPLSSYRVDWGDGSVVTEVAGLRIAPKSSMDDPHIAVHTYQCGEGGAQVGREDLPDCAAAPFDVNCFDASAQECRFTPLVQVTDNWGICSSRSGTTCGAGACKDEQCAAPYRNDDYHLTPPANQNVWVPYPGVIRVAP